MNRSGGIRLAGLAAIGLALALIVPPPQGVENNDWHLLVLFLATVAGILLQPVPVAVMLLLSLAAGSSLGLMTLAQALDGYSSSVTWIIVIAFLFARAFVKTGLGRRIALTFIEKLGRNSLFLGYALTLTDLVLAPATPSNTARAGAIVFPVARSLSSALGSEPGPSARRIGGYLLFTCYQANVVTSATFLTAMAANALSVDLARRTAGVEITWPLWLAAASLPAAVSILALPWLIHRFYPPEMTETSRARSFAREQLDRMGRTSPQERILAWTFAALAVIWGTAAFHSVSTVSAAMAGLCVMLLTGVLEVDDLAGERPAWNTFIWFGGMLSLAGALADGQLLDWFIEVLNGWFGSGQGWAALAPLGILYYYLHYLFASMTAQIIALYVPFLAAAVAAGAPPLPSALLLCFISNLYATLTHYGDGCAPIFFGSGYIEQSDWWRVGFILSIAHLAVWMGLGPFWWRLLGIG